MIAGVVLAMAGGAQADNWVTNPNLWAGGLIIDTSSIKTQNGTTRVWYLFNNLGAEYKNASGQVVAYSENLVELDCSRDVFRLLSVMDYQANGSILDSQTREVGDWEAIAPGTIISAIEGVACRTSRDSVDVVAHTAISAAQALMKNREFPKGGGQ